MRTIALELSGGKDSVACLYLLHPWLNDITVYWLNTGDVFPETLEVINECRKITPHFVEVRSDVKQWRRENGMPTDVAPSDGRAVHLTVGKDEIPLVSHYICCAANIMAPLHDRVVADGNTHIIRGQKAADAYKGPLSNGETVDGLTFCYPLQNWTDKEVLAYLRQVGAPIHPIYFYSNEGADCMHCTGWWDKTNLQFLARHRESFDHVMIARGIAKRMIEQRMELC